MDTDKLIESIFNMARKTEKAIIFIEEIDVLLSARFNKEDSLIERSKLQLLL